MKKLFFSIFILTLVIGTSYSQRPNIPPELQAKADDMMEEAERLSDKAWEKAWPIVKEQARNGERPYIPWAGTPRALNKANIPAFPGAEGGGMWTPGGRGGEVYVVTSLADSGPGTLREACEAGGARIVVFNVAGIIRLESPIFVRAPYITIAGQTAPGDGVVVAGETFAIETHDVIIRHMRFRRGETFVGRRDDSLGGDAIGNIIIDHCSVSWGLDETLSLYRNMWTPEPQRWPDRRPQVLPTVNLTIQNTITAEALNTYNHAFGNTIGGLNSTFIRNLFANNTGRNPSIGMWGDVGFVNNVLFNWWHRTMDGGDYRSMWNVINNYYKPGPVTPDDHPVRHRIAKPEIGSIDSTVFGRIYAHGNVVEGNEIVTRDNWEGGIQPGNYPLEKARPYLEFIRSRRPFEMAHMTIRPADEAFDFVLNHVGATIPTRDPVDERILKQVRTGVIEFEEGLEDEVSEYITHRRLDENIDVPSYHLGIITSIDQVGGYPEYNGEPYLDSDGDGMPDWWEVKHGLDPHDPSDAKEDLNGDGYTNIEMFINGIDPNTKIDWTDLKYNYDTLREKGFLHKE